MAPLLAIPPFPGARPPQFAVPAGGEGNQDCQGDLDPARLLGALAKHRVGGCYWGRQIAGPALLDADSWPDDADPWALLDTAEQVALPADDPRCVLAVAANKPLCVYGRDGQPQDCDLPALLRAHLTNWQWRDPFSGAPLSAMQAIDLCGFWRRLIDSNRPVAAAFGFAHWKRPTVAPLLWNGSETPFRRGVPSPMPNGQIAIWRSRLSAAQHEILTGREVLEVEDGFIRSAGLGADCVPPLSIIVDRRGVHFDPKQPSDIEELLERGEFPDALIRRAAALRAAIVAAGLSKYERGKSAALPRPGGAQRHVLVPGQVEDDRAVTSGGALSSNLELLRRARAAVGPDAFVIYKPHPDVLAGHRRGLLATNDAAEFADHVETEASMAGLIEMVDELHVNSSLAGFEGLIHGKPVTVHGVPFYAGWGLTTDHGPVPARRTARRSLDELVAATYLLYPRYLDPETGLPCPAEVLVERLAGASPILGPTARVVVTIRRAAGRISRLRAR